jgi:hypothetical protein
MPSFSKVLILSTLFLSGALSLPVAHDVDFIPAILARNKREAAPGHGISGGLGQKREASPEPEAAPGGFRGGGGRGRKREASPEPEAAPGHGVRGGLGHK